MYHFSQGGTQQDRWENRPNRMLDLTQYLMPDKVAHISIEDAGFDNTAPVSVRKLYEDGGGELREVSTITSALNMEYDKMMFAEMELDS